MGTDSREVKEAGAVEIQYRLFRNHPAFRMGLRYSGRLQEQGFGLGVDQDVYQPG